MSMRPIRRDRHWRRPQRPGQRRLPGARRPEDADPGTAAPGGRRGHHRGAAARLLVHDLQLRALAAAAADHPGAGADQARLPAAADAHPLCADGERGSTCSSPATMMRTCARSPGTRRTTPMATSSTATTSIGSARPSSRCSTWSRRTRSATIRKSWSRLAALGSRLRSLDKRTLHNAVRLLTGSAADFLDDYFESEILKGYLASSLDHRLQGRPPLAGVRPGAPLPLAGRARRRVRQRGPSTRAATAASPRCWRAPPSRSAPRSGSRHPSSGC